MMAGESWYAVFNTKTGKLVSTGTEVASKEVLEAKGLKAIVIAKQPDETVVWDEAKRDFVPATAAPEDGTQTVADLVVEQEVLKAMSDEQKEAVRQAVANVVGA